MSAGPRAGSEGIRLVEALVQTGSTETAYIRAGYGLPVLLLDEHCATPLLDDPVARALTESYRVIAPRLDPAFLLDTASDRPGSSRPGSDRDQAAGAADWLRGVIDGLGLDRPRIVGSTRQAALLETFARSDLYRVDRLALLDRGSAARTDEHDGPDSNPSSHGPVPVRRFAGPWEGAAPVRSLQALLAFLSDPLDGADRD